MPAAAMLFGGFGLRPEGGARVPPWGDCVLNGVLLDGHRTNVTVKAGRVETESMSRSR
jgi:hypothetical protein